MISVFARRARRGRRKRRREEEKKLNQPQKILNEEQIGKIILDSALESLRGLRAKLELYVFTFSQY